MNEAVLYKSVRVLVPANQTFGRAEFEVPRGWNVSFIASNDSSSFTTLKNNRGEILFEKLSNEFFSAYAWNGTYEKHLVIPGAFGNTNRIIIEVTIPNSLSSDVFIDYLITLTRDNSSHIKYLKKNFTIPANQTQINFFVETPSNYYPSYFVVKQGGGYDVSLKNTMGDVLLGPMTQNFISQNFDAFSANYKDFFKLPDNIRNKNQFVVEIYKSNPPSNDEHHQILFILEPKLPIKPPFDIPVPHHSHHAHHPNPEKIWKC